MNRNSPHMEEQAKAKAMNAVFTDSLAPRTRWRDDNGFLHISLRFMRTGTLKYPNTPEIFVNGVPPDAIGPDGKVTVMVEPDDLGEPESLSSLSGLPGLREHDWAKPEKDFDQIGSVAGVPAFDGEFVTGEAVITDAEAIARLESGELVEVSAAYTHEIDWTPGEHQGTPYTGKQRRIRYNHFVLLPAGGGRAGRQVRVTNGKEKELIEPKKEGWIGIYSRKLKKLVFAQNADDAEEIAKADAKDDAKAENESTDGNDGQRKTPAADLPTPEQVQEMKNTIAALNAKIEELTSQQQELLAAANGNAVEEKAEQIAKDRDEVVEVMNSAGIDKEKAVNSIKEKRLYGRELKVFAMNSIREAKGRKAIPEEQAANEIAVNAMWDVVKDAANAKTVVVGSPFTASAMNADDRKSMHDKTLHGLGFRKK